MKQILVVAVADGQHYITALIPEKELQDFDLDKIDDLYYCFGENNNKYQEQVYKLFESIENGEFKKYQNPTMPITIDRVIQIGAC